MLIDFVRMTVAFTTSIDPAIEIPLDHGRYAMPFIRSHIVSVDDLNPESFHAGISG
jgi:hypothetical protein